MFETMLHLFTDENESKLTRITIKITEIGCYIVLSALVYSHFFGNYKIIDLKIKILLSDFLLNGKFLIPLIIFLMVSNFIKFSTFSLIKTISNYFYLKTEIPLKALASSREENIDFINKSKESFTEYLKKSMNDEQIDGALELLYILDILHKKNGKHYYNKYNSVKETLKITNISYNLNLKYLRIAIGLWLIYIFQDYSLFKSHPLIALILFTLFLILILFFIFLSSIEDFKDTNKSYLLDIIDGCRLLFSKNMM